MYSPMQQSPLSNLLNQYMTMYTDQMCRQNQMNPNFAEEIKRTFMGHIPHIEQKLVTTYGQSLTEGVISNEVQQYINNYINTVNNTRNISNNIVGNNLQQPNFGFSGGGFSGGGFSGGGGISVAPGRLGTSLNNQPNPYPQNQPQNQPQPQSQPIQNTNSNQNMPMPNPQTAQKPFRTPKESDGNQAETNIHNIEKIQLCRDVKTYKGDNYNCKLFDIELYIPENDLETCIHAFELSNPNLVRKTNWLHDIKYQEMCCVKSKLSDTEMAIKEITDTFATGGWEAAYDIMKNHSQKFNEVMENVLVTEINDLLSVNCISAANLLSPSIECMDDIEDLYTLSPDDPDWAPLVSGWGSWENRISTLIGLAFRRVFGNKKSTLKVPEDTHYISKCKDIIIRKDGFTETTPLSEVTSSDGSIDSEYIEAFSEQTIMLMKKRVLYTNVVPDDFMYKLINNTDGLFSIEEPQNMLEYLLYHRMEIDTTPFQLFLYSTRTREKLLLKVGKSVEGHIIVSK